MITIHTRYKCDKTKICSTHRRVNYDQNTIVLYYTQENERKISKNIFEEKRESFATIVREKR